MELIHQEGNHVNDDPDEKRRQIVTIIPAIKNLLETLDGAWHVAEHPCLMTRIKWGTLNPKKPTLKICCSTYKALKDQLIKLRYCFLSVQDRFEPKDFSTAQGQYEFSNAAHYIMPISTILVSTLETLTEIYKSKPAKILPTIEVSVFRVINLAQDIERVKLLWLELIEQYEFYLDGIPMRIESDFPKDEKFPHWDKTLRYLHKSLVGSINKMICRMICGNVINVDDDQGPNTETGSWVCTLHKGDQAIIEPKGRFDWEMDLISTRMGEVSTSIDKETFRSDKLRSEVFFSNLSATNLKYLNSLKDQLNSLREMFSKEKSKNIYSSFMIITRDYTDELLELSQTVTEQILNSQISLRLSMEYLREAMETDKHLRLSKLQIYLARQGADKLFHCWWIMVRCIRKHVLDYKKGCEAYEAAPTKPPDNGVDENLIVLRLEIDWRFELCFEIIDWSILHLSVYSHSDFLKELKPLTLKLRKKLKTISEADERLDFLSEDGKSTPRELRIDENNEFLITWSKLLDLLDLLIGKASRQGNEQLEICSMLKSDQLILVIHELDRWINDYCVDFQNGLILSKDRKIGKTVNGMIESIKNLQSAFFKTKQNDRIVTDEESSDETDRALGRIENLECHIFEIERIYNDFEDKEIRLWLKNWLDQMILVLKQAFKIHGKSLPREDGQ
ncbi:expressed protein [Phakopsora pachyrhizi]|uniref:Expressed protein n=1 Tax=Phakopsora pachyrhizi TaxID=170000 RepID=A0AAV0AH98_PHAPC|nr:expressed protein [Phakopsora pachyrhizi]